MANIGKSLCTSLQRFHIYKLTNKGMSCTLYAANGCSGASVTLPQVGFANLADLHFQGMANSFMCVGAM
jgi:hypothetical protein